jgi:hypothetical protein
MSLILICAWTMKITEPIKYTTAATISTVRTTGLPLSFCGTSDIIRLH